MSSLKGYLLVASPHMVDPNFARTVVFLIHHSPEGAMGVVLNRPIGQTIKELWEKLGGQPCAVDRHVHFGGPVPGPLMALHNISDLGDVKIPPGVYVAAEREHLQQLVSRGDCDFRLFVGYAGWGKGQLESELDRGDWFTIPARVEHVFADESELWANALREVGGQLLSRIVRPRHVPEDPSMN